MAEAERLGALEQIRESKAREPFSPFIILTSSGNCYQIEVGPNLVEMKSELFYAYPGSDRFFLIQINQIAAVERPETRRNMGRRKAS
jgi:hypothetical protein